MALTQLAQVVPRHPQSPTEYSGGWQKAKETTSTFPLQVYFSHYMAGIQHTNIDDLNAMLAEIPLLMGYSSGHWSWVECYIGKDFEQLQGEMALHYSAL